MRLLTHNLLICPVHKYSLTIENASRVEIIESDFQPEFIIRMIPRLEWETLKSAARAVDAEGVLSLPEQAPDVDVLESNEAPHEAKDELLKVLHRLLVETHVVEAYLRCKEGERYRIDAGIPNLLADAAIFSEDDSNGIVMEEDAGVVQD